MGAVTTSVASRIESSLLDPLGAVTAQVASVCSFLGVQTAQSASGSSVAARETDSPLEIAITTRSAPRVILDAIGRLDKAVSRVHRYLDDNVEKKYSVGEGGGSSSTHMSTYDFLKKS